MLVCAAWPAFAQDARIADMTCTGTLEGARHSGSVVAELYAVPEEAPSPEAEIERHIAALKSGRIKEMPGVLRLFGDLRGEGGRRTRFEVYLGPHGKGVGSIWRLGRRDREVIMRLALGERRFVLDVNGREPSDFACDF